MTAPCRPCWGLPDYIPWPGPFSNNLGCTGGHKTDHTVPLWTRHLLGPGLVGLYCHMQKQDLNADTGAGRLHTKSELKWKLIMAQKKTTTKNAKYKSAQNMRNKKKEWTEQSSWSEAKKTQVREMNRRALENREGGYWLERLENTGRRERVMQEMQCRCETQVTGLGQLVRFRCETGVETGVEGK